MNQQPLTLGVVFDGTIIYFLSIKIQMVHALQKLPSKLICLDFQLKLLHKYRFGLLQHNLGWRRQTCWFSSLHWNPGNLIAPRRSLIVILFSHSNSEFYLTTGCFSIHKVSVHNFKLSEEYTLECWFFCSFFTIFIVQKRQNLMSILSNLGGQANFYP